MAQKGEKKAPRARLLMVAWLVEMLKEDCCEKSPVDFTRDCQDPRKLPTRSAYAATSSLMHNAGAMKTVTGIADALLRPRVARCGTQRLATRRPFIAAARSTHWRRPRICSDSSRAFATEQQLQTTQHTAPGSPYLFEVADASGRQGPAIWRQGSQTGEASAKVEV